MTARPSTSPVHRWLPAILLGLLVLMAGCSADDSTLHSAEDSAVGIAEPQDISRDDDAAADEDAAVGFGEAEEQAPQTDAAGDAAGEGADPPAPPSNTAVTGERIIKEGTITLSVDPGQFDTAFGQVIARAQELGGHVVGSSSSTEVGPDEQMLVSGQVTVRVPVRNFEDLLRVVGDAGEVVDRNVTSQDVTAEFVDLESRRRHLQAQERFYLGLLTESESVQDAIAVQQQLDGIQRQIEQISGRLNLLQDRTAFSTLTVRIREQGAASTLSEPDGGSGGLVPYLEQAVDTLVATVGSLIVVGTFLLPFVVLGLFGIGVWRMVRRRGGSRPAPQPPAHQPPVPASPDAADDRVPAASPNE